MFDEMRAVGVEANISTYLRLYQATALAGRQEDCQKVRKELEAMGYVPNEVGFSGMMKAAAAGGLWDEVSSLIGEVEELGWEVDEEFVRAMYAGQARAQARQMAEAQT